jgi:hypothetical protein
MNLLALLLACALPVQALPPQSLPASSRPAGQEDPAARLAAVVMPINRAVAVRVPRAEAQFAETFAADARIAALEARRPGLRGKLAAVVRDAATDAYAQAGEQLQADAAGIYRERFSADELATLTRFFTSPTGQAMIALSIEAEGDTARAFEADRRQKLLAMLQNPSAQTKADLTMLMNSGLLPKVRATNPPIAALSARRFGDVDTLLTASLPGRIDQVIAAHTKEAP